MVALMDGFDRSRWVMASEVDCYEDKVVGVRGDVRWAVKTAVNATCFCKDGEDRS
jgi:hypothetical protein